MSKITNVQANQQGLFTVNAHQAARQQGTADNKSKTIFAGDLNMGADSILAKKQKAQRDAMKIIADAFQSDLKTDAEQQERLDNIDKLKQKNKEAGSQLKDINNMQKDLMEEYGVTEDSEEYQDLELMRKAEKAADPFSGVELTEEEQKHLAELREKGLTDYQQRALSLDKETESVRRQIEDNNHQIGIEESEYRDAKMERLKSAPMAGAVEDAEAVLESASKEIIGDLIDEVKDNIDEKVEEEKKKQKEKEEEKKEEEKQEAIREAKELEREILLEQAGAGSAERAELQAAKAKAKGQAVQQQINGDVLDNINKGVDKSAELEKEIRDILEKMRLLQEDIKGAAVDEKS